MRYSRISVDGRAVWARVDGDVLRPLRGSPLEGGGNAEAGRAVPVADATFLPPVVPNVFYAVGMNYKRHAEHAGVAIPERPEVGYRANNALIGHGQAIVKPDGVEGRFEAEGEVVAVIGRRLRRATYAEAREAVFGWTIGNDVSARAWQHADRSFWRSKNSDTFKPMGPWIETDADPLAQTTTVRVDGEVRASFRTGAMIFDPYEYIVETTRYITMHPGDVLWMGADATVQLEPGSTVDIEISGIGTLSNPVLSESRAERQDDE
ncbi:2-keto-4-pentenoate hydratase [Actinomadura sp. NBRC 104412]|uniref:fumarylacetoacetate hydrolase family protein n=1 Tax=Actinomadura sp. NBRC 104412 TaxID=3032203 RepID=UPI0024A2E12D|nr:fumarylacetoacetate hydrolase family protein [Actinomadura sp. NBRC 104412]GLZ06122.1 2-keto-4-pentenoate hydratase [Actinomadura sp. NBRC 104412]